MKESLTRYLIPGPRRARKGRTVSIPVPGTARRAGRSPGDQPATARNPSIQHHTALIVDDEPQIRRLLKNILLAEMARVLEAETGQEALDLAAAEDPGVIILDLGLPDMAGVEVCREIRKWSAAWIIVLSVRDSDRDKALLFDAGADDYVTKPFSKLEFTARIRAHQRRVQAAMRQPTPQPMTFGDLVINISARAILRENKPIHLTPIEWDLLRLFVMHSDHTLTHSTLLNEIWGSGPGNPLLSLQVHIANLRRKIEHDASCPKLILTEPGVGYRWVGDLSRGTAS